MRVSVRSLVRAPVAAGNMAALMSLSQLSSGSLVYETYYRQVDRGNTGRVGPTEAALFLKKSELSDSTLGKIWELADPDGKGYLDKQGFFVALRLVACAQNGKDVSIASLSLPVTPPKFRDTSSPSLSTTSFTGDSHWAVRMEERGKFEGIFESLAPVNGLLSGDKVKPVLMNSKLPLDVLGRIWDLSDIDKDGHLDKDEFAVAMHLVYRAMEKEPVPFSLPPSLIPPSKRKKGGTLPGSVPVLPLLAASPSFLKESLQSTSSHGSISSLNSTGSLSPKPSLKSTQPTVSWVVPLADRGRYDELFLKLDSDLDGLVGGTEVKEVFMQSGLPQTMLAHVWTLADTRQKGKLTREQFSLAMHLIQQKVKHGLDPPQALAADMLPPSERGAPVPDSSSSVGSVEFTGVKELDDISQEIAQLQREKYTLEQEIREKEEAIRLKTNDVQEKQSDLDQESSGLQDLETQKQDAQVRLEEMDQQKSKLGTMLEDVQLKCQEEAQKISSVQVQIQAQESDVQSQEDELNRAKADLTRLQQEEAQLEQSIKAGQSQLDTITRSLRVTQDEINQARSRLAQIRDSQEEVTRTIEQCNAALNGGSLTNLAHMGDESGSLEDSFQTKSSAFGGHSQDLPADPFRSDDPFQSDPFKDPFGADPFQESDPFKTTSPEDFFTKSSKADPFSTSEPFSKSTKAAPFSSSSSPKTKGSEAFGTGDPFGSGSYGNRGGFADFSQMSQRFSDDRFGQKYDMKTLAPKKVLPSRPTPPSVWK
ncbi:epidermal growth factor receptor substrate 15-like 1 isoform X2 [Anguilla anguilla]|uniref:epidermal growth factor receptor substrate 15-like 1 isoform X2 n=1 Tax=Anguilla anguilla TaxID=7936 RepID=UPI0015AEF5BE|nr:epidermal growth factor receptor substrate 15-like 1 isoform X2 [Anguilla anguilla]